MFAQQNTVAAPAAGNGLIAIDEHTSLSCLIHDVTTTGLILTLLDGTEVPSTFVLFIGTQARVCTVVSRRDEEIEASFADVGSLGRAASHAVKTQRVASGFGRRTFAQDRSLRRAA